MKSILERMNTAREVATIRACTADCWRWRQNSCVYEEGERMRCYLWKMHYEDAFTEIPFED